MDKHSFLRLRKEWYDRLAEDGFEDIEIVDWSTGNEIGIVRKTPYGYHGLAATMAQEYYRLARHHVYTLEVEGSHDGLLVDGFRMWAEDGLEFREIQRRVLQTERDTSYRKKLSRFCREQTRRFMAPEKNDAPGASAHPGGYEDCPVVPFHTKGTRRSPT